MISIACLAVLAVGSGCGKDSDSKAQQRGKTEKTFDAGAVEKLDAIAAAPGSDGEILPITREDDRPDVEVPALVLE